MELQELLNRATERPWVVGCSEDLSHWPVFRLLEMVDPTSPQEGMADAELIQHAVNGLEPLLAVLCGITASLQAIIECDMGPFTKSAIATQIKIAEEAIRRVEEVTS